MIPPEARTSVSVIVDYAGDIFSESYLGAATHGAGGAGLSPGNSTSVMSGYDLAKHITLPDWWGIRWNKPFAQQVGKLPDYNVYVNGRFGGKDNGGGSMETYASMQQVLAPLNERRWFVDLHHMNPSNGVGGEVYSGVGQIAASLVSGTSSVYRFTVYPGDHTDLKHYPPMAYAGPYLLRDMSGPASLISDSTKWTYCFVYKSGECQPNSIVGQVYTSVPQVDVRGINDGQCVSNWYAQLNPCVLTPFSSAGWGLQYDISRPQSDDNYWRKITQGFSGMGRQYQFGNITPIPDGSWGFIQCYWCDGVRNDVFAIQFPTFPGYDSVNRADFVPVKVQIPPGSGVRARVKFGYSENGPVNSFYCSSRQESCVTDSATTPFAYVQADNLSPAQCANGCTINVPGISGRVLYYRIERVDNSGNLISADPVEAAVVP